ncbi:cytochrome P450, partial [Neoconidiobolus thromboides FSU 785]
GYTIPANTDVLLSIYTLHHDERYWNEPEKFIPERFIKGSSYAQNNPVDISAWTPFGGGARSCIGMNFSLLEQKAVLAMILLRYKVNYPKGSPQIHGEGLSLSPAPLFSPKDYSLNFTLL